MTGRPPKVGYVLRQGQTRRHHCHWPGCEKQVPPAMWGCREHWYALPMEIRTAIWRTFKPGQEVNATPSRDYVEAARKAQEWIADFEKYRAQRMAPGKSQGELL